MTYAHTYPQFLLAALGIGIAGGGFAVSWYNENYDVSGTGSYQDVYDVGRDVERFAGTSFVDWQGVKVRVRITGPEHLGPTVVLESGLFDVSSDWHWIQRALASRMRVFSYDRPGTGFSDAPPPQTRHLYCNKAVPAAWLERLNAALVANARAAQAKLDRFGTIGSDGWMYWAYLSNFAISSAEKKLPIGCQ